MIKSILSNFGVKHIILLFSFIPFTNKSKSQIVITAPDYACPGVPVTFNLYQNGSLNTQPAVWSLTTPNINNVYTVLVNTPSTFTVVFNSVADGCDAVYRPPVCLYAPYFGVKISPESNPSVILASKSHISIKCPFPITGPTTLALGASAIYNIPRSEIQVALNANWYTVWIASPNLQFVEPFELFNSSKIKVQRTDVGTAYLYFYMGDGVQYIMTIL
jgi:hypothetical protein